MRGNPRAVVVLPCSNQDKFSTEPGFPNSKLARGLPQERGSYCAVVRSFREAVPQAPREPWCGRAVRTSHAFAVINVVVGVGVLSCCVVLSRPQHKHLPRYHVRIQPPSAQYPAGRYAVLTSKKQAFAHLLQCCCAVVAVACWQADLQLGYDASADESANCNQRVCLSPGRALQAAVLSAVLSVLASIVAFGVSRQSYESLLRKLSQAAQAGDAVAAVKWCGHAALIPHLDQHCPAAAQRSPLHWACRFGHVSVLHVLMQAGADPRKPDGRGWNAMHYAARHGHTNLLRVLLSTGFGPDLLSAKVSPPKAWPTLRPHPQSTQQPQPQPQSHLQPQSPPPPARLGCSRSPGHDVVNCGPLRELWAPHRYTWPWLPTRHTLPCCSPSLEDARLSTRRITSASPLCCWQLATAVLSWWTCA